MSEAAFRCLLRLYPAIFRQEYGDEALQLLRDRFANERGFFQKLRLWWDIAFDLVVSLPRLYRRCERPVLAGGFRFQIIEGEGPRRWTIIAGMALSLTALNVVHAAIMSGGSGFRLPPRARAQGLPSFEVSSVKRNTIAGPSFIIPPVGDRFVSINSTLRNLVGLAFRIDDNSRIPGGPNWMDSDRFDVEGRAGTRVGSDQMMLMLQSLLQERFKLKVHRELREMPVYFLVVGKDSHKMEQLKDQDGKPLLVVPLAPGVPPPPPPPPPGPNSSALRQLNTRGWDMGTFATILSRTLGRPVIDKTGLTGLFVFKLEWTPDALSAGPDVPPPVAAGPSIFTAVQEQLGLKLEPQRAPVEFIVVDSAERPSEN